MVNNMLTPIPKLQFASGRLRDEAFFLNTPNHSIIYAVESIANLIITLLIT